MSIFKDEYDMLRIGWVFTIIGVGLVLFFAFAVWSITVIERHFVRKYCVPKGQQLNRETKFAEYGFWEYQCLVKADNGTFVPIDSLYNNIQEK